MSRRRIERSIWSNGLRRRSARISALDQQQDQTTTGGSVFPVKKKSSPLLTNGQQCDEGSSGIKRKRQEEGIESQIRKEHSNTNDKKVVTEAKEKEILDNGWSLLPDKHLLELVLDVLQRRDTHEIFAEPVDPQEVEEYYEIVKEPMDFGTMRAKLHEGMYNTLEEFEHDAFLIPRNALLFNSTGSVYFRQARAIDDLAKKVFHVLKTNPKKLESEFSGTRRRSSRRTQEGKSLKIYPRSRFATNVSASGTVNIISPPNGAQYSDNCPSDLSESMTGNPHLPFKASCISTRGSEFSTDAKDGRRFNVIEMDRRATYQSPKPFDRGNGTIDSSVSGGPKLLTHVNPGDISYSESLMKFAKDLGPVAQMVAKRKLQGRTNLLQKPGTLWSLINLNGFDDGNSYTIQENDTKNSISKICGGDEVFKRHISKPCGDFYYPAKGVENLNLSGIRLNGASSQPFDKLEYPGLGIRFRNDFTRGYSNLKPTNDSMHLEPGLPTPSVSPFAFSLSFLKTKLNKMEHFSGNQVLGEGSSNGEMSMKRTNSGCYQLADSGRHSSILAFDNRQRFVPKSLGGNLAL